METGTAMAILVVFDGPPEKAVESPFAEILLVVGVDVREDELKLEVVVVVQNVDFDDRD